jgi:transcription elongation factor greB
MNEYNISSKNYLTPAGWQRLKSELFYLVKKERPRMVDTVSWAANNGDRSENGDYLYGKRRLREIDHRIRYLTQCLQKAEVIDPETRPPTTQIFFGAKVSFTRHDRSQQTVYIVGVDEIDLANGKISWRSPLARALIGKNAGDQVILRAPEKEEIIEIKSVEYLKID